MLKSFKQKNTLQKAFEITQSKLTFEDCKGLGAVFLMNVNLTLPLILLLIFLNVSFLSFLDVLTVLLIRNKEYKLNSFLMLQSYFRIYLVLLARIDRFTFSVPNNPINLYNFLTYLLRFCNSQI